LEVLQPETAKPMQMIVRRIFMAAGHHLDLASPLQGKVA